MCSEVSTASSSTTVPGTEGDLLNQVLSADTIAVPKVSVPLAACDKMKLKMDSLSSMLGREFDQDQTYHVTSEETFLSASRAGEVAVIGPQGAMLVTVTEPSPQADGSKPDELWRIGLSVIPTGASAPSEPHVTMGVMVGGTSAKIASYETSDMAAEELGMLGLNVLCIIKNGGASILTTIVSCLPSLAGGPQAFMAALTASLGTGSVDLITKVMACF